MNKSVTLALFLILYSQGSQAQSTIYEIDITRPVSNIRHGHLVKPSTNPGGISLDVNSHHFIRNGKPWFPVMGEFHFIRYPYQYWEEEIIKMKSGGLSIVATYIFWNAHEYPSDTWNWEGIRDLRRFVELCQKHDMYVWLRIGPWSHGEQLHGGHPDWINSMRRKRSNDPKYLEESQNLYVEIGQQVDGLFFKDGGPIIGIQLENEYASGDPDHIGTLKQLALDAGIQPAFFTITANTVFHDDQFEAIPLQGGYPYRGWEKGGGKATKDFLYANDQWIMTDALGKVYYDVTQFPKGLCEQGCGSQMTFKNRFTVEPHVIEAHLQNQVGRGMNLVGYYMFQGGTQLPGLKEPGYPESYDFQAPISEFGYLRPSYKYLKILHNFINDFGEDLASTFVYEPENPIRDELNTSDLRYVVRSNGNGGYVFLNNTQVRVPMPDKRFKLRLHLENETIEFPKKQLTLKGETNAILPFNYNLEGAVLKYATAQPVSRFMAGQESVLVLTEISGMDIEMAFESSSVSSINAPKWDQIEEEGLIYLKPKGKVYLPFEVKSKDGGTSKVLILTREQAENSWRVKIGGQESLIISKADLMINQDQIELRQLDNHLISMDMYPAPGLKFVVGQNILPQINNGDLTHFRVSLKKTKVSLEMNKANEKIVNINLPGTLPDQICDIVLDIDYWGGSATASINDHIVTDHLFHGRNWQFGLTRYLKSGHQEIKFEVQDWSNNISGVSEEIAKEAKKNEAKFKKIKATLQYKAEINLVEY